MANGFVPACANAVVATPAIDTRVSQETTLTQMGLHVFVDGRDNIDLALSRRRTRNPLESCRRCTDTDPYGVHDSFSLAIFDPKSVLRMMDRASGHKLAAASAVAHWLQIYGAFSFSRP